MLKFRGVEIDEKEFEVEKSVFSKLNISALGSQHLGAIQTWNDLKSTSPLLLLDFCGVMLSWQICNNTFLFFTGSAASLDISRIVILALMFVISHGLHGLYPACGIGQLDEFLQINKSIFVLTMGMAVGAFIFSESIDLVIFLLILGLFLAAILPSIRIFARSILSRFNWWCQPVLVVGESDSSMDLYRRLLHSRRDGLRPLGIAYNPEQHWSATESLERCYIGPITDLESILVSNGTARLAVSGVSNEVSLNFRQFTGIPEVILSTKLSSIPTLSSKIVDRQERVEIHCTDRLDRIGSQVSKRLLDLSLIFVFSPILIAILLSCMLLVRLGSPGPIFYCQQRIGRGGKRIWAWKFRTMVQDADKVLERHLAQDPVLRDEWNRNHKLKRDPRISRGGRMLRKTSLDELPQLWNVVVNDMSLVGPRPIVEKEIEKYGDTYEMYLRVQPGLTGLWQISGRNNTTYNERLHFDRYYVRNWSCSLDLFILFRTFKTVILQEGAY